MVFIVLVFTSFLFGAYISDYLTKGEHLIREMKEANAKEETPYLYWKAVGYYEGIKLYAKFGDKEGTKRAYKLMEETAYKAVRGAYTNREPMTELITFEPRIFFAEYCDGILDECFYEEKYEKEEFLELLDYFSLRKRVKFLRRNNAKYCAPKDYGKVEALFNLISIELMKEKPDKRKLMELKERLIPVLILAEEKVRYAMNNKLSCYMSAR
ncbi:hypothetical protein JCM9492_04250 [Aquifex pyrophilus]